MIIKNEISYEIICATLRIEPKLAYFEFVDHPISRIKYTLILDKMKNNNKFCLLSNKEDLLYEIIGIIKIIINNDREGDI